MIPAQNSVSEEERIESLKKLKVLDSPPDESFDLITKLCANIFNVPAAFIAFVDLNRAWFKSAYGLVTKEVPRQYSFSSHTLDSDGILVVPDAKRDNRFSDNPMVAGSAGIRFFAGVKIKAPDGSPIGAIGILDQKTRELKDEEISTLKELAELVENEVKKRSFKPESSEEVMREVQSQLTTSNRKLAEEKARHAAILGNIGDGIIVVNAGGEITYVNEQTKNILGFSEEEMVGKPITHVVSLISEDGKEVAPQNRPIRNALHSKKKVRSNDYQYKRKNGSHFPVSITANPVVVFDQVIGGVIVFRDITKEKEIDRMKTEFISLASHQLRTPLSGMKWFSEILLDGDVGILNVEQKELVSNIYKSNERMIELVNALLNISRIESGRIIIDPKPTDITELVNEVIKEIQPKIQEKKHNLVVTVHEKLPKVNIDPKLVRHVYMNIIMNAIKYTPEGGEIVIMVSKSGNELISQISDNGYGIPKHQQDRIFKKFFRAENIIKKEPDGTGLGLYLSYIIVQSSGGKIWFESEENVGTTFWFILPLAGQIAKEGEVSLD